MNRLLSTPKNSRGFTLLELIVVITIIGLLMGVLMVNFNNTRLRARDAKRKAELDQISKALRIYYADYQQFPEDNGSGQINGCGTGGTNTCAWSGGLTADGNVYIQQFPQDPINNSDHQYTYVQTDPETFYLWVNLENTADRDIEDSQSKCGVTSPTVPADAFVVCTN